MKLKEAHKLAYKNRLLLKDDISCFYCFRYSQAKKVTEWVDGNQTALCPHCGIDSILPGIIDRKFLKEMHQYYFKVNHDKD